MPRRFFNAFPYAFTRLWGTEKVSAGATAPINGGRLEDYHSCLVVALILGFANDACHADVLSDLILGNKAATPLTVSPVKAPGGTGPIAPITLPYAQIKPVPAAQPYVDAEVVELTMKSGSQSTYAQDIANKVAETTVWEVFGKGLEKLAGSKMLGLLGNVLEGVKEVGGTPTHGVMACGRWGDERVGPGDNRCGDGFQCCASARAPGSTRAPWHRKSELNA